MFYFVCSAPDLPGRPAIFEAGTGYNNIDLEACREKGIAICNVPEYTTEAMGDYAITLVMALSCSLAPQMKALAKGDRRYMNQCHLGHLDHFEIRGKTYGIIGGLGYIASNISKKALNLGMRVIVSDMPSTPLGMRDTGVEVVTLDDLLKQSDFVSPMVPLNKHTKGLLNAESFDKMKPTAYVINTARGPIVDQAALIDALRKKKIAGAALDVFGEGSAPPPPLPDDSPLYDVFNEFENVILTPHIGWQRVEARQRVVDGCGDNIAKFTRGEAMNIDMTTGLPIRWTFWASTKEIELMQLVQLRRVLSVSRNEFSNSFPIPKKGFTPMHEWFPCHGVLAVRKGESRQRPCYACDFCKNENKSRNGKAQFHEALHPGDEHLYVSSLVSPSQPVWIFKVVNSIVGSIRRALRETLKHWNTLHAECRFMF